jgi:pimeloyl-ACP methyl ester carboxylesterase
MSHTRILCLHGYHGSAAILRRQIAPLAAGLPANVELVFVDAPSLAEGDFGWWHPGFRGWEQTRDWVIELLGEQPCDAIFGFSQGAALAGLLAGVAETESSPIHFESVVMVGGFTSTEPQHARLFDHKLRVPSVHVIGRGDSIVPMNDSRLLAERFSEPVILIHDGGHVIPADPAITTAIAETVTYPTQLASTRTTDA